MPTVGTEHELDTDGEAALLDAREMCLRFAMKQPPAASAQPAAKQPWKATLKAAMGGAGLLLVWTAWAHCSHAWGASRVVAGNFDGVTSDFQVREYPKDCPDMMRFNGCEKERWACDEDDDHSMEYRCCCEMDIWRDMMGSSVASISPVRRGGVSVLRMQRSADACLGGPEDDGKHFSLVPCDHSTARLKLPLRGAGPIQLAEESGRCLGVAEASSDGDEDVGSKKKVEVLPCNQGSMMQMFQLTKGDQGMLQWSHGGNKCLDTEDENTDKGSRVVLSECVYWPQKPSQSFVLEEAPKPRPKDDGGHGSEKQVTHPSLFCVSLMLPWNYEVDMMRAHAERKVGIFQCDRWAVFSNERLKLKDGDTPEEDLYTDVMNGSLKAKIGGKFHTALNTPVFVRFWQKVIDDGRAWSYDWTVKVDPDCVFFPYRLKEMLRNEYKPSGTPDAAVWLNNCQLGLHGPLEVFSKQALGAYKDSHGACKAVAKKHGQEDVFLRHCFETLELPRIDAYNLLLESDWACNERPSTSTGMPPCYDRQVAFHPFKSVRSYFNCYDKGAKMHWNTPLYFNSVPPGENNHHHA